MQVDRRIIESNLPHKGFVREDTTHHRYFYHEYQGKRTGAYTYTSHGTSYKTYGISLLKKMRWTLGLDSTRQVIDLFNCPIQREDYNQILKGKVPNLFK